MPQSTKDHPVSALAASWNSKNDPKKGGREDRKWERTAKVGLFAIHQLSHH